MRHLPVLGLLAVGLTPSLQAEPLELQDSRVTAQRQYDPTAPTLAHKREDFARIPGGAGLVDAETYKSGRSSSPQDALGLATGVFIQPRSGAEESRLSIRGSGLQRTFHQRGILLLQDGAPLNLADGSGDFQAIEPLALDHIEVLRGANAWSYGAANLGGAINFVSPSGRTAAPFALRSEVGSFGYRRLFTGLAGALGDWDGYLSLSDSAQDGDRDHAEQANQRYFGNLGGRLNERLSTRFYLSHVETDSQIPGSLTQAQVRDDPRQANAASRLNQHKRDFTLNRLGNLTSLDLGDDQRLELSTFYSEKTLWHPIYQVLQVDSEDFGARLAYHWQTPLGWRWSGGLEALEGRNWQDNFVNQAGRKGPQVDALAQTASSLKAFGELEVPLAERWALLGGLAWLRSEREVDDRLPMRFGPSGHPLGAADSSFERGYLGRIGRIGLRHDLADGVQLFGNLSQSFEPPTLSELTGGSVITANDAQRATTLEAGLRWNRDDLELDLALYRSEIRDELLSLNDPAGNPLGTVNADRTLHQGVELGATLTLGALTLRGQYLLNDFRFEDDPVYGDNRIAGVPSQFLRGEVLWQREGWYAGPTVEWVPVHYAVDHAQSLYSDGYALWGVKGGYRPGDGLGFFIEGRNLSDRAYVATTGVIADARGQDSAQFMPGDGRSLFAGLEWRL
ncbi:MAG: TonB-dependent receptor [Pseudomonas sp.]|uniref:TonB-dependent receptor family protein n=1 Tax=Pseudomonas sp. TaxID=306 RepID=UPI0033970F3D